MTATPGSIKYGYAHDASGQIISIEQAVAKRPYTCISCNNKLTPVLNVTKKQKHFRHAAVDAAFACSPETYLHKLAKQRFYESYLDCLRTKTPFLVTINTPKECIACSKGPCKIPSGSSRTVDLAEHFTEIFPPDSCFDGQFKPDILIRTPGGKSLWVEMVVTHRSDVSKIASGTRIIEVLIDSEQTIDSFNTHRIDPQISILYNFKKRTVSGDFRSDCVVDLSVAGLYPNGHILLVHAKKVDFENGDYPMPPGHVFVHAEETYEYSLPTNRPLLQALFKNRFDSPKCLLCRHYCWDDHNSKPFCLHTESYSPKTHCDYYRPIERLPHSHDLSSTFRERWKEHEMLSFEKELQRKRAEFLARTPQVKKAPQPSSVEVSICRKCGKEVVYSQEEWWLFNKETGECECNSCLRSNKKCG